VSRRARGAGASPIRSKQSTALRSTSRASIPCTGEARGNAATQLAMLSLNACSSGSSCAVLAASARAAARPSA
jgi:hypothetical protein